MLSLAIDFVKKTLGYDSLEKTNNDDNINRLIAHIENANAESKPSLQEAKDFSQKGCFYKTGYVTVITNDGILIDDKYMCADFSTISGKLDVGNKVYYLAYQRNEEDDLKVKKVLSIIEEDWDTHKREINTERKEQLASETVHCNIITRNIIGRVLRKDGRNLFIEPINITINLDKVRSEFIPQIGDWLKLESLTEVNEESVDLTGEILEVDKLLPLRSKLGVGTVTTYDITKQSGIIEKNIFFYKNACEIGYIPQVGDRVVSDSIESDQGICTWRSLTVVPLNKVSEGNSKSPPIIIGFSNNQQQNLDELLKDKHGIKITDDLRFNLKIMEQQNLEVLVENIGEMKCVLNKGTFMSKKAQSQLSLISPPIDSAIVLEPSHSIKFIFQCKAKFVGVTKELFIFCFNGFKIGRLFHISINLRDSISKEHSSYERKQRTYSQAELLNEDIDDVIIIPGIKPLKAPAFIKVRSGVFKVPSFIWSTVLTLVNENKNAAESEFAIAEAIPCLLDKLCFENYCQNFHSLLYLEEIAQILNLRDYDIESAVMRSSQEFLILTVPGLAENRPSLIPGDRAIVSFKWDQSGGKCKYEGFIHKISSSEIYLKFSKRFHDDYHGEDCKVSFQCSTSQIQRCHNAVNLAINRLGREFLFPTRVVPKSPQLFLEEAKNPDELSLIPVITSAVENTSKINSRTTILKKLIEMKKLDLTNKLGYQIQEDAQKTDSDETYIIKIKTRKLIWFNKILNKYQKEAVRNILLGQARPLPYVIFGPPGTGKTITLCETVLQVLTMIPDSRIMVATPSNSSANLVAERLLDSNALQPGDLVRLIANHCLDDGTIPDRLLPYCATGELAQENSKEHTTYSGSGPKLNCTMSILGRHRITVGTCVALGLLHNMGFPRGHFSHIFVDEAGQATEPEILIPLNYIHSDYGQIVLAGDPQQLGPVVQSKLAQHYGFGESFLTRLLQQYPYQKDPEGFETGYDPRLVTKLLINYRSLPEILELPNKLFYDSELEPQLCPINSKEAKLLQSLSSELPERIGKPPPAILFHGVVGSNYQDTDNPSWYNPEEATQVYFYLMRLYQLGLCADDIGIITPYLKQVLHIRDLLLELEVDIPKISSVEGFQGQERKIIILSTVRSLYDLISFDKKYSLGFVASPRRLNVAITRARALLIIIGNPFVLSNDVHWRNILDYCVEHDAYVGCCINSLDLS
ncbi:probable RNA helicase armi [Prorops nasuta]|uniref:probable RNA helicase armi n=1 Tax=Prorops nasuta TaxID=863751 RepID=UPI0034CDEE92